MHYNVRLESIELYFIAMMTSFSLWCLCWLISKQFSFVFFPFHFLYWNELKKRDKHSTSKGLHTISLVRLYKSTHTHMCECVWNVNSISWLIVQICSFFFDFFHCECLHCRLIKKLCAHFRLIMYWPYTVQKQQYKLIHTWMCEIKVGKQFKCWKSRHWLIRVVIQNVNVFFCAVCIWEIHNL